jgi:radical SAM protein with 4Fe4S-binding SPASM domain
MLTGPGIASLGPPLRQSLEVHGFFAGPRPGPEPVPAVQLQLTNRCNLACSYCCTDSRKARPNELGFREWVSVVDQGLAFGGPGLRFGVLGGEALLVPYALDLCEYILERGGRLKLSTNGVLVATAEVARRLARLVHRGAELRVSLAGPTRPTCDSLSGGARFELALAGLQALAREGARAAVDLMLMPATAQQVARHLPALRRRMPRGTRLSLGLLYCGGRELGQTVFASRTELDAALDRIAFDAGERLAEPAPSPVAVRREACPCAFGHRVNVRCDGALFACFKLEDPIGDLRQEPLATAWQRARSHPRPASSLPTCAACPLATLCGGGCRAENSLFTGSPDLPLCGPWRVRVLSELLAEDRVDALAWPAAQLMSEARGRGIEVGGLPSPCL